MFSASSVLLIGWNLVCLIEWEKLTWILSDENRLNFNENEREETLDAPPTKIG